MTALAADNPYVFETPGYNSLPVRASSTIYEGSMVGDDAAGRARALVAGDSFRGHAVAQVDNSAGAAGALDVKVLSGKYLLQVTLTSVAITDVGKAVYASDDATLTLTQSTNSRVGRVYRYVTTNTCVVEFDTTPEIAAENLRTPAVDAATVAIQGYDVDASTWDDVVKVTASNTPTLTLAADGGITLSNEVSAAADIMLANGKAIKTNTTTAHTLQLQAYDVDGSTRPALITLTNANDPTLTLAASGGISVSNDITMANGMAVMTNTTTAHTMALEAWDVDGSTRAALVTLTNANDPTLTLSNAPANGVGFFGTAAATQRAHVADVATNLATDSTTSWQTIAVALNGVFADLKSFGLRASA